MRRTFVQDHHNIAANGQLDIDHIFRRQGMHVPARIFFERDAVFGKFAHGGQAEHLIPAAVS